MEYRIGVKSFALKNDFTFKELEWLDVVMGKLQSNVKSNEVSGSFTKDEIEKTLQMIFTSPQPSPYKGEGVEFEHEDFMECTEGIAVKIIADFFLQKAVQGAIIKNFS
jgi:hypothetical protein